MSRYKRLLSQLAMPILVAAAAGAIAATMIGGGNLKNLSILRNLSNLLSAAGKSVSRIFTPSNPSDPSNPSFDSYAAVYLTGGKVYFGKLEDPAAPEPILKDVFYLTLGQSRDEFRLNKLTGQDNPKNELVLSRDHILYWEPLEPDSKVMQGIEEFHKQAK
jgi:hypothetical protein